MDRLIVNNTWKNAPYAKVAAILATWSKLAELVETNATLPERCKLEWELLIDYESGRGVDNWFAHAAVRMVFHAQIRSGMGADDKQQTVNVPLTEVKEVVIIDDGTFRWHSERAKPEDNPETVAEVAKAVSEGKLPSGHHYRCNWIPAFGFGSNR